MRILLVEDEAGMVDALTAALRRHGIALDHAGTLAAARSLPTAASTTRCCWTGGCRMATGWSCWSGCAPGKRACRSSS